MKTLSLLIFIIWILFWVYWFAAAYKSKRNIRGRMGGMIGMRFLLLVIVIALFRTSLRNNHLLNYHDTSNNPIVLGVGFALVLIGLGFAIWARVNLGENWGMPMTIKQEPELVTSGPYSFVRHPIYTGFLVALVGSSMVVGLYFLVVLLIGGGYFIYSATREEKNLQGIFPKAYPAYKARTKMLIPFIF